jgi:hypothetical protein
MKLWASSSTINWALPAKAIWSGETYDGSDVGLLEPGAIVYAPPARRIRLVVPDVLAKVDDLVGGQTGTCLAAPAWPLGSEIDEVVVAQPSIARGETVGEAPCRVIRARSWTGHGGRTSHHIRRP